MAAKVRVNDEAGFYDFAEKRIFEMQRLFRQKEGLDSVPVLSLVSAMKTSRCRDTNE
jgi:hypothetical protein